MFIMKFKLLFVFVASFKGKYETKAARIWIEHNQEKAGKKG